MMKSFISSHLHLCLCLLFAALSWLLKRRMILSPGSSNLALCFCDDNFIFNSWKIRL